MKLIVMLALLTPAITVYQPVQITFSDPASRVCYHKTCKTIAEIFPK